MKHYSSVTKSHRLILDRNDLINLLESYFEIPAHAEISVNSGSPDDGSFDSLEITWDTVEDG